MHVMHASRLCGHWPPLQLPPPQPLQTPLTLSPLAYLCMQFRGNRFDYVWWVCQLCFAYDAMGWPGSCNSRWPQLPTLSLCRPRQQLTTMAILQHDHPAGPSPFCDGSPTSSSR